MDNVFAETLKHGGGTFRATTLATHKARYGFAVSISRGSATVCDLDEDAVVAALERVQQAFPDAPWIGTWVNEGRVVIDPVVILWDKESAFTVARALGQEAIYDFRRSLTLEV
jgi:hypothetical protein